MKDSMKAAPPGSFGTRLKALREAAGFTQEELATIAGLSVHAVSALERGERRRPQVETVRALSAALDLNGATRDALLGSARASSDNSANDVHSGSPLPLPLTALIGRDDDVRTLSQWLADGAARLITLVGPGGVGKTRLALELARAIAADGRMRVVFVALAPAGSPAFVASAIAEAFGWSDTVPSNLSARARLACADQPTLLVLDNFEHVLDAAPLVADLLTSVPSLRALATSRSPLRLRGEREYLLGPLAMDADSDAMFPADLARSPAVRLFIERVRDVQPDFRLTAVNGPSVAAICRRLDALPLALELAAPWIKVLPAERLRIRLEHDVLLSTAGPRDLPERQQTMNATVAWSYQLLQPNEQRAFRRFSVLPGLFPIDAAAAVLAGREGIADNDVAMAAVASLIDKSLVVRAETSAVATCSAYQMLETVRAFGALALLEAGERDDAMEGLVRFTAGEAALAADGLVGPAQVEWLDRAREDLESYRAALAWLIDHGRPTEATDIAWSLLFFWVIRGHAAEGLQWYERIRALPSLSPADEARLLTGSAVMCYTQGELVRARTAVVAGRALARTTGDLYVVAHGENMLGHLEHAAGDMNAARAWFSSAVDLFRAQSIPWGVGHAQTGLAWAALAIGDAGEAERRLDEAVQVLREAGPWFLQLGLYLRAVLLVRRGKPDEAIVVVRESLTYINELHDKFAFVYALVPLASAAVLKGDDAWAARILAARDEVTERTGAALLDRSVHDLRERAELEVRTRLGPAKWARAYAAGRRTSIDALLTDIDRIVGPVNSAVE
jgi:predicted ATPase/DNA-binding XRE family transcriptional regulator